VDVQEVAPQPSILLEGMKMIAFEEQVWGWFWG
jgi:hypothetical protein